MTLRKRILGLALIALAVPFPALALEGGGVQATGSPGLTVTASLNSCGRDLTLAEVRVELSHRGSSSTPLTKRHRETDSAGHPRHHTKRPP